MANTKTMIGPSPETGLTSYVMVERRADGYLLNDADGDFANAPADPYISATEDSVRKGIYQLDESRVAWDDGEYIFNFYNQSGGSPAPASDTMFAAGVMQIESDAEALVDVTVSSRLAASDYTAPDNATLTLVSKWIQNRLVVTDNGDGTQTVVLYDDNNVTPLKTWTHTTATGTRGKAT